MSMELGGRGSGRPSVYVIEKIFSVLQVLIFWSDGAEGGALKNRSEERRLH